MKEQSCTHRVSRGREETDDSRSSLIVRRAALFRLLTPSLPTDALEFHSGSLRSCRDSFEQNRVKVETDVLPQTRLEVCAAGFEE